MNFIEASIYGIIQGLSEFLPVSSSGHLALLPKIMKIKDPGVIFDLIMHVGTALAVLIYFFKEIKDLVRGALTFLSFTNWKNKNIIIEPDSIMIKTPLSLKGMTLHLNQLKGFEFREILSGYGLIKNVRIITSVGKKIEFFRDAYTETEYQRLINGLKKSNLNYLGTVELKSRNKQLFASMAKWTLVIALILFGLLQIVKMIN